MNKIFKVIWSKTLQRLVVTSELSRGHVKASSNEQIDLSASRLSLSGLRQKLTAAALLVGATLIPTTAGVALWTLGTTPAQAVKYEGLTKDNKILISDFYYRRTDGSMIHVGDGIAMETEATTWGAHMLKSIGW